LRAPTEEEDDCDEKDDEVAGALDSDELDDEPLEELDMLR